jgi:hypothetical protein
MQAIVVLTAGAILGIGSVLWTAPVVPPLVVLSDLAVGWTFLGVGVLIRVRVPATRTGWLLVATAFAWFVPVILPAAVLLHRAVFAHTILAYPTGRLRNQRGRAAALVAYLVALLGVAISPPVASAILGAWLVVIGVGRLAARRRLVGSVPGGVAALLVGVASLVALWGRAEGIADAATWLVVYDVALVLAAVVLGTDLLVRRGADALVTQVVVDLGDAGRSGGVRDRLATALGDPDLIVGFAGPGANGEFVDERGVTLVLPADPRRVVTPMLVANETVGVLVHDPAVLDDPKLVDAVAAATRFAVANARLQASVQALIAEVAASRARLVHAGDAERRDLEVRIRLGPIRRLDAARAAISGPPGRRAAGPAVASMLADLARARLELLQFARGVHPASLTDGGLGPAIAELAHGSDTPLEVDVHVPRFDPAIESALYFVAAEAVANALKHARPTRVTVEARHLADGVVLEVRDDGRGGATPGSAGGLRGLADRVEALGGRLAIRSSRRGTAIIASVPVNGRSSSGARVA